MSVDEIDPALIPLLDPELESGRMTGQGFGAGSPVSWRDFPFLFDGLHKTILQWRRTNYRQIVGACSVTSIQEPPEDDVFRVQETRLVRKRKWWRYKSDPPAEDPLEMLDLEWIVTTTVAPGGTHNLRGPGGSILSPPTCEPSSDEEETKPSDWDTGPDEDPPEGYFFGYEDLDPEMEDTVIVTNASANAAAAANEIIQSTQDWATVKTFSRRTFSGNTLSIGGTSAILFNGGAQRTKFQFRVLGRRLPFKLKWQERTYSAEFGATPSAWTAGEHAFSQTDGWTWEWDVGYPASQYRFEVDDFKVVPV